MATTFKIKKGDTLPLLAATLKDGAGAAINLTGLAIQFRMRSAAATSLHSYKVNKAADIVTAAAGTVTVTLDATDTDTVGDYLAEFVITGGGDTQTIPADSYLLISVVELA